MSTSLLQKVLPPVRNKDYKKKKAAKNKSVSNGDTKTAESKQTSRIKSYDYNSWDKFDVVSDSIIDMQI